MNAHNAMMLWGALMLPVTAGGLGPIPGRANALITLFNQQIPPPPHQKKTKKKPKKQQLTSRKLSKTNLTLIILVNKRALGIIVS